MADNIPLYPDDTNLKTFREFVNVQKEMNEHLRTAKGLYDQIGRINLAVEQRVLQRRTNEEQLMKKIRSQLVFVNEQEALAAATEGTRRAEYNRIIAASMEDIRLLKERLSMSREASSMEIDMAKKAHEEEHRWLNFASKQANNLFGLKVNEFEVTKGISDELVKQGVRGEMLAGAFAGILMMVKGAFDLFVKFDKAAWDLRKAMGMNREEAAAIRKQAERMAIDFGNVGVTVEGAYKAMQELGKRMGGIHNVSKVLAENVSIMSAQLGISEETSANFLRNVAAISKSTMDSKTNMLYMAQTMSAAAGVALDDVMKDVASKSDATLIMMSRLPNVALKSAIELRRMGTSLDSAAKSSKHILDFSQSVNEEMEASVLLGRSINLQRARELAYRRDLEGSTKEILRLTKSVNFENLDPFQQQAFAAATGKSVDELLKMVQADRQIQQVNRSGTQEQKAQLALYEKMRVENEASAKARAKNVELIFREKANQERLTAITAKWNQMLAKAQEFLLPVIDTLLEAALPAMDIAGSIFKWGTALLIPLKALSIIGATVSSIGVNLAVWFEKASVVSGIFFKIAGFGEKLMAPWSRIVSLVGMVLPKLGFFGKILGFVGKWLGPIGWVITAFQGITGFIKGWNSTTGSWIQKLGGGVMGALRSIIPGFDYIVNAVKWVWSHVGGIGKFIFKWMTPIGLAITAFKNLFAFIENMIPKVGKMVGSALGWLFGGHKSVEHKAQAAYIPAVTVTPNETKLETTKPTSASAAKEDKPEEPHMTESTGQRMCDLLEKILAKDVNVHMDGQLLSTSLARQTEFRGGYGVNKV